MARFDVYRHPDTELRARTPYLIDVQNDYIDGLDTRVVLPVRSQAALRLPMRDLNPLMQIEGEQVVVDTAALAAIPASQLRQPVANVRDQSGALLHALDALFGSY